jgi:hypothetical protein
MSWADPNCRNGWLALDRNENGRIDDFSELFGDMTVQPHPRTATGIVAFNDPKNGGNGNAVIDPGIACIVPQACAGALTAARKPELVDLLAKESRPDAGRIARPDVGRAGKWRLLPEADLPRQGPAENLGAEVLSLPTRDS